MGRAPRPDSDRPPPAVAICLSCHRVQGKLGFLVSPCEGSVYQSLLEGLPGKKLDALNQKVVELESV